MFENCTDYTLKIYVKNMDLKDQLLLKNEHIQALERNFAIIRRASWDESLSWFKGTVAWDGFLA